MKALPKAVNTYYAENKTQYSSIEFNNVQLAYYKIKDGDKYEYLPVWVFAQCEKTSDGDSSQSDDGLDISNPLQLIMLNAETGELIDLKSVLNTQSFSYTDSTVVGGDDDNVTLDDSDLDEDGASIADDSAVSDDSSDSSDDGSIDINDLDLQVDDTTDAVEE